MSFWIFIRNLILLCTAAGILLAIAYFLFIRPWMLRMGATDTEVAMAMPGDDLIVSPSTKYTQAVTVKAPKDLVWAYLIQVGYRRAGWYNVDFVNRFAAKDYFYENNRSADRIIPELQGLKQGDTIYILPQSGLEVSELKDKEYMLLTAAENGKVLTRWVYQLKEIDPQTTRLYVRWTSDLASDMVYKLINTVIVEPLGAGIQQTMCLHGIKNRAERDYENR